MTASNFQSLGASAHTLQDLAEQGQSTTEAIQQRAARWAEQQAQAQAERQRLPLEKGCLDGFMGAERQRLPIEQNCLDGFMGAERQRLPTEKGCLDGFMGAERQRLPAAKGCLDGFMGSADHDRAQQIRLELERRQQHAVMHSTSCSSQTPAHSVSQDIGSPGMVRCSSANLESSCNPRDPRQDPRGMKRVSTVNCLSTSPAKRLLPFPHPSADVWTGTIVFVTNGTICQIGIAQRSLMQFLCCS